MQKNPSSTNYNKAIVLISVVIPIAVAALYYIVPALGLGQNNSLRIIGLYNAIINSITACVLVGALLAIKSGKIDLHKKLMFVAIGLGTLFLLLYVAMHATTPPVSYGGEGGMKIFYYCILISHILLSAIVLPFVLIALARALNGNYQKHKKVAKWAFPIWLYVSITGVIAYVMISQYY